MQYFCEIKSRLIERRAGCLAMFGIGPDFNGFRAVVGYILELE